MKKQDGFTLMELIIVIVILGILSSFSIPRYMSLDVEARTSIVKGLHGSIMAASEMVHGVAIAKRLTGAGSKNFGGGLTVNLTANSYPVAMEDGIGAALTSTSGFTATVSANSIRYDADGGTAGTCSVTYNIGPADAIPTYNYVNSGC
ncbi:MAG: MSHA pilin protein MshA [uncultured bacterium]|nr:MAG: MSHA pilin protein MshA [uncultured bacterium]